MRRAPAFIAAFALVLSASTLFGARSPQPAPVDPAKCSLIWPGFEPQLEEACSAARS